MSRKVIFKKITIVEEERLFELFERNIDKMFESVVRGVGSLKMKHNTNDKVSRDILKRSFIIHIINLIYSSNFNEITEIEIEKLLNKNPKPSLKRVLRHAFSLLLNDIQMTKMRNTLKFGSTFPTETTEEYVDAFLTAASESLLKWIKKWSREGTEPKNIDKRFFNIWDVDFSDASMS